MVWIKNKVSSYRRCDCTVGGQGGLNFPSPALLVSAPFCSGSHLCAFCYCETLYQCCKIFPISPGSCPLWMSLLLPPLLPPPIDFLPTLLPSSRPPVLLTTESLLMNTSCRSTPLLSGNSAVVSSTCKHCIFNLTVMGGYHLYSCKQTLLVQEKLFEFGVVKCR